MSKKVSRRRFVVGLAAAGVLAVGLLAAGYGVLRGMAESAPPPPNKRNGNVGQATSTTTATTATTTTTSQASTTTGETTATTASAANPTIMLVTLKDIVAGKVKSARTTGSGSTTKTTGLNGIMVEVQNAKVVLVSGPNSDTDFDIIITDPTVGSFKTENIRFPLRKGSYLVSKPKNGDVINIVGTPYHDVDHWEIHPIFAWQPASMGLITSVCAPAGTVSKTQQICWSGTS